MIRKLFGKYWPLLVISTVIFAFFSKLFIPEPSIFVTPDFGRSDLYHFNIPLRFMMQKSLKNFELPLWESNIGQGFPLFDEGQIGFFYIPNILLFGPLPFWLAFNLGYVVSLLTAAVGTYLLARSLNLNKWASYLSAITYSFSPIIVLHLHHYNLIQTVALMPWLFWLVNSFFNTRRIVSLAFVPIILAQQLFAGFPQIVLYSLTGLLFFFIFKVREFSKKTSFRIKISSIFAMLTTLGFLTATVQLMGTYTILQQSNKLQSLSPKDILTSFPFKIKNLLTVIDPYILGSPVDASYPNWIPGRWSIFWESNAYFGIVQFLLVTFLIIALFIKKFSKAELRNIIFWIFLGLLGIGLSLGNEAPFHPLFSIPPFSYFRVPSRFLILTFLSVAILAGYATHKLSFLRNKKIGVLIASIVVIIATVDIFRVWSTYPLVGKFKKWTAPPDIAYSIDKHGRVYTIGDSETWNRIFLSEGWEGKEENYFFNRNFLAQNSNLLFNISQVESYAGMNTKRKNVIENLLLDQIKVQNQEDKDKESKLSIEVIGQKIMDLNNTRYLISNKKIDSDNWREVIFFNKGEESIILYESNSFLPQVFGVTDYTTASTIQKFTKVISDKNFNPAKTVILEKTPEFDKQDNNQKNAVSISDYQNTNVKIDADLQTDAIVVLSDSYYPGWEAKIDGRQTEIFAANINSRAIVVPKGKHKIEYRYNPKSIKLGGIVSFVSLILSLAIIAKYRKSKIT